MMIKLADDVMVNSIDFKKSFKKGSMLKLSVFIIHLMKIL